uniref:Spt6 acidic N-terminal domain-containing protein n=1 Tax=Caenorhabditis japonica TaxID=281687 RepID=A0A8R1IP49_CAEJA
MDFIDNQAEESDDSMGSDVDEPQFKKRKVANQKSKEKRKTVASSDEDEDDDDDDDAKGREEMKGFIADEDDEEDDNKSEKSEKSRHSGEDELDDEDLDLINENLDIRNDRRVNRVRLGDSSDEDEPVRPDHGDDDADSVRKGDDDQDRRRERNRYGSESERSEDDFIEDDGDAPRHRRKHHRGDEHMPEGAEEDARDVFGVEDFNFDEFYDDDDGEDGLEDEEEEIIEDDGEGGEIRIRRKKDTSKKTTLLESIEPSELERGFLSAADKKIMIEDAPERFQLRRTPVTEADDDELERESQWVMKFAFEEQTVSNQNKERSSYDRLECIMHLDPEEYEEKKKRVLAAIKEVLRFIRVRSNSFEVPFIAFYRKEYIDNLLSINHLWKIYDYDEKWCHLLDKKIEIV